MTQLSPLPGVKELLLGVAGTGKTASIATWLEAGIMPCCIFTEPSFEVLGDAKHGRVLDKIHWNYCPAGTVDWTTMVGTSKLINTLTFKGLSNLDYISRDKFSQLITFLTLHNNFQCQRTGKSLGNTDDWGTDKVLVWDSLTGLSYMAITILVGAKPVRDIGEWGACMDNLENIIRRACFGTRCHFMLAAHMEPERNEVSGTSELMASTLGKKLAPKLPQMFSDVIIAKRSGGTFTWSVIEPSTQAKTRNLPFVGDLKPSFAQVIDVWKSRGGIIETQEKAA